MNKTKGNLNTLINAEGDFEGHFSSETNLEENVKGTREIVRGTVREEGHETVEHHDVRQDSRDGDTVEKGKRNVDSECASSETDLTDRKSVV